MTESAVMRNASSRPKCPALMVTCELTRRWVVDSGSVGVALWLAARRLGHSDDLRYCCAVRRVGVLRFGGGCVVGECIQGAARA